MNKLLTMMTLMGGGFVSSHNEALDPGAFINSLIENFMDERETVEVGKPRVLKDSYIKKLALEQDIRIVNKKHADKLNYLYRAIRERGFASPKILKRIRKHKLLLEL